MIQYCHNHSHKYIAMGWAKANNVYDTVKPLFYHLKLLGLCADIPSPRITPKNDIRLKMYLPFFIGFYASITFLRISRHDLVINSIISSFIFEMAHAIGTLNSVNAMVWFYLSQAKIAGIVRRLHQIDVALLKMHFRLDHSKWHFRFAVPLLITDLITFSICGVYIWSITRMQLISVSWIVYLFPLLYLAYAFNFVLVMVYGTTMVVLVFVRYSALNGIFR